MNERDKEFFILLLVLVAGVFGVFVSQDLFVFFLFYEIAVLPMYLLDRHLGPSHARSTRSGPVQVRVEALRHRRHASTPR